MEIVYRSHRPEIYFVFAFFESTNTLFALYSKRIIKDTKIFYRFFGFVQI